MLKTFEITIKDASLVLMSLGVFYYACKSLKNMKKCIQKTNKIKNTKILTTKQLRQKGIKNGNYFLKLKCLQSTMISGKKKVGSNYLLFNKFSLSSFMDSQITKFNSFISDNKGQNTYQMMIQDKSFFNPYSIVPMGQILNNEVLNLSYKFKEDQKNILWAIVDGVIEVFSFIAELLIQSLQTTQTKNTKGVIVPGPSIGKLEFIIGIASGYPIIAECAVEEGVIRPKLMGLSKIDFLDYYEKNYFFNIIRVLGSIVLSFKLFYMAKNMYCKKIKQYKAYKQTEELKKGKMHFLDNSKIDDEKQCIICYARCRNVIFFSCRHLAVCKECSFHVKQKCPLCKTKVEKKSQIFDCEWNQQ